MLATPASRSASLSDAASSGIQFTLERKCS